MSMGELLGFLSVNHHEPKGRPSTRATRSGDPGYERRSWAARERPELTKEGCKGTRGTSQDPLPEGGRLGPSLIYIVRRQLDVAAVWDTDGGPVAASAPALRW